jgi:3alpha(or 20beta)-hydroxysteroid dehydrogenase
VASLEGTVAIVTGGARGMGAEHVRGLVRRGAMVVAGDVLDAEGEALAAELGDAVRWVHLDVTDEQEWHAAISLAESAFGPVGALVNNAGIVTWGSIEDMSAEDFRRTVDINLTGTWLGMHAVVPSMRRAGGGSIVNISSTAGLQGYANIGAYVASKWGVRGLTKAAALELAPLGVRVNSIHPGPIRTPMTDDLDPHMADDQPIPRRGEPEEVTAMLLFVLADATYTTGHEFVVDGGKAVGTVVHPAAHRPGP